MTNYELVFQAVESDLTSKEQKILLEGAKYVDNFDPAGVAAIVGSLQQVLQSREALQLFKRWYETQYYNTEEIIPDPALESQGEDTF